VINMAWEKCYKCGGHGVIVISSAHGKTEKCNACDGLGQRKVGG
jgi:DnaJ-class molecular chaperone